MRNTLIFFLKHYLFWIALFIFFRLLFLVSLYPFSFETGWSEILFSTISGIQLDISVASYVFIISFFALIFRTAGLVNGSTLFLKWYYCIVILICILISISNIIIYSKWGTLINNRALAFALQPKEMLASVTTMQLIGLLVMLFIISVVIIRLHSIFVLQELKKSDSVLWKRIVALLIILPMIVIGLRGGLQLIPVNESAAVYSSHNELNLVAINAAWYLGHNLKQSGISENNQYNWMDKEVAAAITKDILRKNSGPVASIFNFTQPPNVVIILLESWTFDIVESLGGIQNVTPNFHKLTRNGLLFKSIYSSGFRTDQALISVLSGFPSTPNNSIIRFPSKATALPALAREFKKKGYNNSFYYGGELGFANMNSYLINSGYEKIISKDDFEANTMNSKWGAHDEFVLNKHLEDLSIAKQPFFSTLLTLSSHEPFEVPIKTPFNIDSESEKFKKAGWYTDHCLGEYFRKAEKMPWYKNTIFILVADHGHKLPLNRDYFDPEVHKIPLLITGELLNEQYRGTAITTLANQHDIAATLLRNLDMSDEAFHWSVNIMDSTRVNYAYLSLDIAMTWMQDTTTVIVPFQPGYEIFNGNEPERNTAKAYMQHLYESFLSF